MSIMRFDAKRDSNDSTLIHTAMSLGLIAKKFGPLDYWACWASAQRFFWPLEIKAEDKKGRPSAYTQAQRDFMIECDEIGIHYEIWGSLDDIESSRRWALARARPE